MDNNNAKLLTIFTEASLESTLVNDIEQRGGYGYTITNARGRGAQGSRQASWEANSNIRVEIICNASFANEMGRYLQAQYYPNYAMVTFISDVQVLRPEKFE
jgi:hypothetical protein